jgi:hypothetical protein
MTLTEITQSLRAATSLDHVRDELEHCAGAFDCQKYTYVFTNIGFEQDRLLPQIESDAEVLTNLDPGWAQRYLERKYFSVDPVVRACYQSSLPVVWSSERLPPEIDPDAYEMLTDAYQNGLRRGISVPIHGFSGDFGIFSLYSPGSESQFRRWADAKTLEVQRFAFWFHDFFAARFSNNSRISPDQLKIEVKGNQLERHRFH